MPKKKQCAKCKQVKTIICRGLCWSCRDEEIKAGTLDENFPAKRHYSPREKEGKADKRAKKKPPQLNRGVCSNPSCGKSGIIVPESGLCVVCHAAEIRTRLESEDYPEGKPRPAEEQGHSPEGEDSIPSIGEEPTAKSIYRHIRSLEIKCEAYQMEYRKLRRKMLDSLNEAREQREKTEEKLDQVLKGDIDILLDEQEEGVLCRHRTGSGERIFRCPESSLELYRKRGEPMEVAEV